MRHGSSEEVRAVAFEKYFEPALRAGKREFSVAVKDVLQDLVARGFPPRNTPQVCTALRKETFLRQHGIEIERVDGPPSQMSTTVVFHYRLSSADSPSESLSGGSGISQAAAPQETAEEWARRLTGKISGILKDELAEYGGSDAFIRWVRGYDEEDAA